MSPCLCEQCGKELPYRSPSRWRAKRFCDRKCAGIFHADQQKRRRKPCPVCGVGVRPRNGKTCSRKCYIALQRTRPMRTCPICKKEYYPGTTIRVKYCSKKCYDAVRCPRSRISATCTQCGKAFTRWRFGKRHEGRRLFCSTACRQAHYREQNHPMYRGGSDPNRGSKWLKLAESIRARDGYQCRRCRMTQDENGRRLDVDHIKPWRSFENKAEANDPSNLVALCSRCHKSKTSGAEHRWLRGDGLDMAAYERAVNLP